jgi:pyruvate dehydrogenase E2 component (dihydrolipoamide acetyltransferase)
MPTEVILPRVDMDMVTGRISHWFVKPGASIAKGAPLFEIETDKAAMEIDAPASGRVQILVDIGTQVPVGSTVGWILADDEGDVAAVATDAAPVEAEADQIADSSPATPEATAIPDQSNVPDGPTAVRATPLSRRLAAMHGIDLGDIAGSGPNGRVQAADVEARIADLSTRPSPAGQSGTSGDLLNGTWLRQGAGTPIVMIHGFGSDLGGWRPFIQGLPATLPIYAVDLPGHGGSSLGDSASLAGFAQRVIVSLKAAGISGGHVVGHSLGGAVATLVATDPAFAARSLFLIAPGGLGPNVNGTFIRQFAVATEEASIAIWMRELVAEAGIITPALVKATVKARAETNSVATLPLVANRLFPEGTQGALVIDRLQSPEIPTSVVFGRDDRIIPAAHAERLGGRVGVHLYRGVGHLPHYEIRDEIARLLLQHIRAAG